MVKCPVAALRIAVCLLLLGIAAWSADTVPRFGIFETTFTGPDKLDDPYRQVAVSVTFTGPPASGPKKIVADAFWDGGTTWHIRMAPTELGEWSWRTTSATKQLDGLTGRFLCMPSRSDGFLRTDPVAKPGLFLRGDKPVFLLGCSGSALSDFSLKDGSFQKYVDARAAQGFNLLYLSGATRLPDNEAGAAYLDPKTFTPNPVYFQAADQRMYYCRLKGMVPIIVIGAFPEGIPPQELERLWQYMVARYAAFDVLWEVSSPVETRPTTQALGALTRKLDPYGHPIMTEVGAGDRAFDDMSWLGVAFSMRGLDHPASLQQLVADGRPVINHIGLLENLTGKTLGASKSLTTDTDAIRRAAWQTTMLKAYPIYEAAGFDPAKPETIHSPGARQVAILGEFFRQTEWYAMTPAPKLLLKGEALVLAKPGFGYVAYLPQGGPVTLDVSAVKEGLWVQWFDPRTGKVSGSMQLPARQELTTEAPDNKNDWVLHVSRVKPKPVQ